MSETVVVSGWVADLRWEDLPTEVVKQAKRCLLDFLACSIGGAKSEPGHIVSDMAIRWQGRGESTVIGAPTMVPARHAAFANATMANALDYDDTLFGHPGATTFPAVLAAGEKWRRSGKEVLLAAVIGYELSVRTMALLVPLIPRYQAMWDLGTLQSWGATAAAARLAGLDAAGVANAVGLISGTAPVPLPRKQRYSGEGRSMLKSAYGWAADGAILATELTCQGFTGPGHVLDDNMGFWQTAPSDRLNIATFSDALGQSWAIQRVAFKPYMACRFIHPVLQAVEEILHQGPLPANSIEKVEVSSFSLLADEHHFIQRPVSGTDAQFSVPFTVAVMLRDGRLTPESYQSDMLRNPDVLQLVDRVEVKVESTFENAFPDKLGALVRVVQRGGTVFEARVDDPKGSDTQPLLDEELAEKFHSLAGPSLSHEYAKQIWSAVEKLEQLTSLEPLMELLRSKST